MVSSTNSPSLPLLLLYTGKAWQTVVYFLWDKKLKGISENNAGIKTSRLFLFALFTTFTEIQNPVILFLKHGESTIAKGSVEENEEIQIEIQGYLF